MKFNLRSRFRLKYTVTLAVNTTLTPIPLTISSKILDWISIAGLTQWMFDGGPPSKISVGRPVMVLLACLSNVISNYYIRSLRGSCMHRRFSVIVSISGHHKSEDYCY